jgi:hypothetical protein
MERLGCAREVLLAATVPNSSSLVYDAALGAQGAVAGQHSTASGHASLVFPSGVRYVGSVVNGLRHGSGTLDLPDGTCYTGTFVAGKLHGRGTITYADGSEYAGEVAEGVRHGSGSLTFAGAMAYTGGWVNGLRHGSGTLTYGGGSHYKGEWDGGRRQGRGLMRYPSGNTFVGQWVGDRKCGLGRMTWGDRDEEYVGYWLDDAPHGYGVHSWYARTAGGRVAVGEVDEEEAPPFSPATFLLVNRYAGTFIRGFRCGSGVFAYSNGARYVGEWYADVKHGHGLWTAPDGSVFDGLFLEDRAWASSGATDAAPPLPAKAAPAVTQRGRGPAKGAKPPAVSHAAPASAPASAPLSGQDIASVAIRLIEGQDLRVGPSPGSSPARGLAGPQIADVDGDPLFTLHTSDLTPSPAALLEWYAAAFPGRAGELLDGAGAVDPVKEESLAASLATRCEKAVNHVMLRWNSRMTAWYQAYARVTSPSWASSSTSASHPSNAAVLAAPAALTRQIEALRTSVDVGATRNAPALRMCGLWRMLADTGALSPPTLTLVTVADTLMEVRRKQARATMEAAVRLAGVAALAAARAAASAAEAAAAVRAPTPRRGTPGRGSSRGSSRGRAGEAEEKKEEPAPVLPAGLTLPNGLPLPVETAEAVRAILASEVGALTAAYAARYDPACPVLFREFVEVVVRLGIARFESTGEAGPAGPSPADFDALASNSLLATATAPDSLASRVLGSTLAGTGGLTIMGSEPVVGGGGSFVPGHPDALAFVVESFLWHWVAPAALVLPSSSSPPFNIPGKARRSSLGSVSSLPTSPSRTSAPTSPRRGPKPPKMVIPGPSPVPAPRSSGNPVREAVHCALPLEVATGFHVGVRSTDLYAGLLGSITTLFEAVSEGAPVPPAARIIDVMAFIDTPLAGPPAIPGRPSSASSTRSGNSAGAYASAAPAAALSSVTAEALGPELRASLALALVVVPLGDVPLSQPLHAIRGYGAETGAPLAPSLTDGTALAVGSGRTTVSVASLLARIAGRGGLERAPKDVPEAEAEAAGAALLAPFFAAVHSAAPAPAPVEEAPKAKAGAPAPKPVKGAPVVEEPPKPQFDEATKKATSLAFAAQCAALKSATAVCSIALASLGSAVDAGAIVLLAWAAASPAAGAGQGPTAGGQGDVEGADRESPAHPADASIALPRPWLGPTGAPLTLPLADVASSLRLALPEFAEFALRAGTMYAQSAAAKATHGQAATDSVCGILEKDRLTAMRANAGVEAVEFITRECGSAPDAAFKAAAVEAAEAAVTRVATIALGRLATVFKASIFPQPAPAPVAEAVPAVLAPILVADPAAKRKSIAPLAAVVPLAPTVPTPALRIPIAPAVTDALSAAREGLAALAELIRGLAPPA